MKVALVVPGGVDRSGEHHVIPALLAYIERLAALHDVHVFALNQEPKPADWDLLGARVHNIGVFFTRSRTLAAIMREHRHRRFDIVHAFWSGDSGLIAVIAGRLIRVPVLVHIAGGELCALPQVRYGGRRSALGRLREGLVLRYATTITAASEPIMNLVAELGYRAQRVPLGVDLKVWPVCGPQPRDVKDIARLIHVAHLNAVKDQTTLLQAMKRIADSGVRFHLDIVGLDTLAGAIQTLAENLGLAEVVSFHGLRVHRYVYELTSRAHLNLVSSLHEAGPLAVLEAAVVGVPTVGTAVGHIVEWAPAAAMAVPAGNARLLSQAIQIVLDDEPLRLKMAAEAQRRAISENADFTAAQFLALYKKLTSRCL